MRDVWAIGPTAATCHLRLRGFTPREAERLVALKISYDRGAFREITALDRLRFGRYLVRAGWFDDRGATRQNRCARPLTDLLREIDELAARRRRPGLTARDDGRAV
jgi:hypothetical protein